MISVLEIAVDCPVNKTFSYLPPKDIPLKDIVGKRVKVPFGSRLAIGYVLSVAQMEHKQNANKQLSFTLDLPQSPRPRKLDRHSGLKINLKTIIEIIDDYPIISEESIELARFISQNYVCSIGEALSCIIPQSMQKPKRKAQEQGSPAMTDSSPRKILTPHQQAAFDKITKSLANNEHKDFLLYGVTASGKTEIYLNAIEYALNLGKSSIMLIPEISLTAQFEEIVFKRFGSHAALWHSNISNIEKYKLFYLALNGEIKVMLGARSAVFAPFKNLGLIIIDEEHEHTYKQEQKPSYDCREIAFWRARRHNACAVLGSATPSLETYKSSLENNIEIIRLPQRIDAKKLPDIKIISLKDKPR
ncbi:MAG: DEAD/DEAH box helicase family protein, partial [Elusimicrobiota bacterium]|nr:DEAD/DEAH box helicase family protein [Elusimicrobiota bacterium]